MCLGGVCQCSCWMVGNLRISEHVTLILPRVIVTPSKNTHPGQFTTNIHYTAPWPALKTRVFRITMSNWWVLGVFEAYYPCLYFLFLTRQLTDHGITSFQKELDSPTIDSSIQDAWLYAKYILMILLFAATAGILSVHTKHPTPPPEWIDHIRRKHIGFPTNQQEYEDKQRELVRIKQSGLGEGSTSFKRVRSSSGLRTQWSIADLMITVTKSLKH
jgi:hypothetical protein